MIRDSILPSEYFDNIKDFRLEDDGSITYWFIVDGAIEEWRGSLDHNKVAVWTFIEKETVVEETNMSITVAQLKTYINAGLNIMVVGPAGTGKTAMLKEASEKLGLQMKYYNAATLDPFADLLGIPVPDQATKTVEYYRPHDVDQAEVVFVDELNRASTQTTNAIFEMIQFRTINGEPLSNLKCVVAAMNPVEDGYDTDELDIALLDRFDVYLNAPPECNVRWFEEKFGKEYARAGIQIFNEYQNDYNSKRRSRDNNLGYFSPRRLEKLLEIFKDWSTPQTVVDVLPKDVIVNPKDVSDKLNIALGNMAAPPPPPPVKYNSKDPILKKAVSTQLSLTPDQMRKKSNINEFFTAYEFAKAVDKKSAEKLLDKLAVALAYRVGPSTIDTVWKDAVKDFSLTQETKMIRPWGRAKTENYLNIKATW